MTASISDVLPMSPPAIFRAEGDLPFVEVRPGYTLQLLHVNLARNLWVVRSKVTPGTKFNPHRHTGPVFGFTHRGLWRYEEYGIDYPAGAYVFEPANSVHPFAVPEDATEPSDVWFAIWGANIQLDSEGNTTGVTDARSIRDMYVRLCVEQGYGTANIVLD